MRKLSLLLILCGFWSQAQNAEADTITFEQSFAWLERKLTFNYYDPTNEHWWVNRIQKNEDGTHTIKNIAAKHPKKILNKVYHNRTLFLWDLSPNSVSVITLDRDQGRFVKGKIVRVEGYTDEKTIQVVKDGKVGSKVNYIHISVPEILEDSVGGYAEQLAERLKQTLRLSARLYNRNNTEDNITAIFKAFRGKYKNEEGNILIDFEVMDVGLVRFTISRDQRKYYGTIGYDSQRKAIYFFNAGSQNYTIDNFEFDESGRELVLLSGTNRLHVVGRNTLNFNFKDLKGTFERY